MGKVNVAGVAYENPKQIDQNTILFPPGTTNMPDPGVVTGAKWKPNFAMAIPKSDAFDPTSVTAPPIAVNKPVISASDPSVGGKMIPGTSAALSFKNPA